METPAQSPRSARLALFIAIGAIIAIVIVALVVVFTAGEAEPLDESTPEGVVQRYIQAVYADELSVAAGHLDSDAAQECEPLGRYDTRDARVTLSGTSEQGDSATVEVLVVTGSGGGIFGQSDNQRSERFRLTRDGDGWAITDVPWRFMICTEAQG